MILYFFGVSQGLWHPACFNPPFFSYLSLARSLLRPSDPCLAVPALPFNASKSGAFFGLFPQITRFQAPIGPRPFCSQNASKVVDNQRLTCNYYADFLTMTLCRENNSKKSEKKVDTCPI